MPWSGFYGADSGAGSGLAALLGGWASLLTEGRASPPIKGRKSWLGLFVTLN